MANVTVVGNIGQDVELKFTTSGQPVATINLAESRRWKNSDGEEKESTTWWRIVSWGSLAENIADSLGKGDRVLVSGRAEIRSFKDADGNDKWVTEITAYDVAPSLRWATAKVEKNERKSSSSRQDSGVPLGDDDSPF